MIEFDEFRETVEYDGHIWKRYPLAKDQKSRNYYGCGFNGKKIWLHRYIYEKYNGPIPKGLHIDHIDNNPLNNNIDNLQALSTSEHNKKHFCGKKHSIEHIEKCAQSRRGKKRPDISIMFAGQNNPFYGKKHSDMAKAKMSLAKIGKAPNNKGTKHKPESIEKIRQSKLQLYNYNITIEKINELLSKGLKQKQIAEHYGCAQSHISRFIKKYILF